MAHQPEMDASIQTRVSRTLDRVAEGHAAAVAELFPLVYDELRRLARWQARRHGPEQTLQATALVHEVYLRLVGSKEVRWENRAHFMAVAATAMRQILANHARDKRAVKRGGDRLRVTLQDFATPSGEQEIDLVALNDAMKELAELDSRQGEVVKLRFLGGMTTDEISHVLGVSPATVKREWRAARAWLNARLTGASGP